MASSSRPPKTYDYGSVVISLENCIIPKEKLKKTPSVVDGLNLQIETDLRIVGCEYIQTAGILLKLPQVAMATGQVLFQRFYYSKSFVRHDVEVYAMASLFLAAKIEESPRRVRDVINVFHHIKQRRNHRPVVPMDYMGNTYFTLKNLVIKAERRILKELGFCVHVQHPHKVVITFLQVLDCEKNQALAQTAWNFMNDALRTNVFVRYQPGTIACACVFLSARQLKIALPSRPAWWELFDVTREDIEDVCLTLLQLYQRPKVSLQVLNKAVEKLKKTIQTKKTTTMADHDDKSKKKSSETAFSRPGSPSNISPVNDVSKSRSEDTKKNGGSKTDSQPKASKKSSKTLVTRKEIKNQKPLTRSESPVSERSHSASGSESGSAHSSNSDTESDDSGSSHEGSRKRKTVRHSRRDHVDNHRRGKHDEIRAAGSRKIYKSKIEPNTYRRTRDRSRSPYRRSRSRSRERREGRRGVNKGSMSRNGDYKSSDKRERSGRR